MDLIDDDAPARGNAPEFTVSEISGAVKRTIEGEFAHVRIRGEIGRVSRPRSGHVYLDLKDDRAVLSGVMWKGVAARAETQPEEGLEVIATGRLTTFPGQSKYQIVIERIEPAGIGALMAMLEKRRQALAAEGLFDAGRKRPLPYLPEVIGVVTSPSGAVIRDILHRLRDRFPRRVLIWPVAVQGAASAPEVARAIRGFNALQPGGALPRPDLLIVARGGGSLEDLWGFNEEAVVRAAADSVIPLISAVGHETDTTLIDHAADRRAPTPSAAAEMAVPVRTELAAVVTRSGARMAQAAQSAVNRRQQRLADLGRGLPRAETLLDGPRQRLDRAGDRLEPSLQRRLGDTRHALERLVGRFDPALRQAVQARALRLGQAGGRLSPQALRADLRRARERLDGLCARLDPGKLDRQRQRAAGDLAQRVGSLQRLGRARVEALRARLDALERQRQSLGYEETLRRGYAVVRDGAGAVLTQADAARAAGAIEVQFADGRVDARTDGKAPTPAARPRGRAKPQSSDQGRLF